jgi:hypothetical protein
MATFIDDFDGAAGTLLSSRTGWAKGFGYYDIWQLDGSGAASHPAYSDDGKQALHDTGSLSHYVKVVLGAGFLGSARGCGIILGGGVASGALTVEDSGGDLYLFYKGGSIQNLGSGWAAGDELEVVWDATAQLVTVRRNGVQVGAAVDIAGRGWTDNGSSAGLDLAYSGQPARTDVFRSFEAGPLAPPDTTPPTLTGAITLGARTASSIETSCPAGADNVAVTAYDVRRNGGAWVDKGLARSHTFTGLAADTAYTIEWAARDAAGNRSAPLLLDTRTYRAGALASTILLVTGAQDGNPAGFLYAFAGTVSAGDWLSYTIVSGPTPAGGSLDANAMGAFSYTGPAPATMVIQPEVNGANAPETITVTLYDNSVSLGSAPMASTPTYGSGPVSQAAPVPLTGTAVAVASAYGSGQIAQGAPVVLAGAAFAVIPAMGNGAVSQGAPVALSGAALAVVPAMGAGGLVQGVPVALSATPFAVIPVFSAGALSQAAPVVLMGAALSVSTAYGPGAISDAPTFTSMAPSPVCATYRRDSYPAHTFQKLAGETLDFDIDFRYELRSTQDAARIHDPVEIVAGQGIEVLGAYWVPSLRSVKLWVAGGEAQGKSDISIWLNTAAGRRLQVDVRVQIK